MYRRHFRPVLGFHGCDSSVAEAVINRRRSLRKSNNEYDWLGPGVYFWENSPERALDFAREQSKRAGSTVKNPAVIGAVLDLGLCLDLTDLGCLKQMTKAYSALERYLDLARLPIPENNGKWRRNRDCAVINMLHQMRKNEDLDPYDSVKSPFPEGDPLYAGTDFTKKAHVQIAICNPNCIKGVFWPRKRVAWP
jgi:hypothetical protein